MSGGPCEDVIETGVYCPHGAPVAEFACHAERLGFDHLACGEHVMFHGPSDNAFVVLAAAAGATTRIGLLSSVVLAPLYPAALLAKLVAEMDRVSGGRFALGVGVGGEFATEFEACGVPVRERGARTDEALEVLDRLLTGDDVSFDGRFTRFAGMTLRPRPERRPRFWIGGRGEPSIRRAARAGDAWLPYLVTPERLQDGSAQLVAAAREHGRDPATIRRGLFVFANVAPDGEHARRVARERLTGMYRQDFTRLADRYAIAGTPAQCRERLREYVDAGAETVVFSLVCEPGDAGEVARAIAEDVLGLPVVQDVRG